MVTEDIKVIDDSVPKVEDSFKHTLFKIFLESNQEALSQLVMPFIGLANQSRMAMLTEEGTNDQSF